MWRRQWPAVVDGLLAEAAAAGDVALDARVLHRLIHRTLPHVLDRLREPPTEADLVALLERRAGLGPWEVRRMEPIWWACGGGRALALLDPAATAAGASVPPDWSAATGEWGRVNAAVLPTALTRWPLGPADPLWDGDQVIVLEPAAPGPPWRLTAESAAAGDLVPLPALAGRVGSPGQAFWDAAVAACRALGRPGPVADRTAFLAPLAALVAGGAGSPPGGLRFLPCPRAVLRETGERWDRPPPQHLIYLHRGQAPDRRLPPEREERELRQLPRVEVWRSGWPHPFEEEALRAVLEAVEGSPSAGSCSVWVNGEFAHVVPGSRFLHRARECDLLLLAPAGLVQLECKSSLDPRDLDRGHGQMRERCGLLWAAGGRRGSGGGVFLLPLLMERLDKPRGRWDRERAELARVAPPTLAAKLRACRNPGEARRAVLDHYQDLADLDDAYARRRQPLADPGPPAAELRRENRDAVPAVLGWVVVPDEIRVPLQPFQTRNGEDLRERLCRWLQLPPVFSPAALARVHESLSHLARAAEVAGVRDCEGFTANERRPGVIGWEVFAGEAAWTGQPQTVLSRRLTSGRAAVRAHLGRWLARPLRNFAADLRWLDVRGLPATHERHLHRVALVVHGELRVLTAAADLPLLTPAERLDAAAALVALGAAPAVSELLGESASDPAPLAQRLLPGEPWRHGWLPGEPPRREETPDARRGLARVLAATLRLLSGLDRDPVIAPALAALQRAGTAAADAAAPPPETTGLIRAFAAAANLSRLAAGAAPPP